ncbi:hypothetical protein C8R46DRAFT_1031025 [Mycena filopes]|nr:hypothetical protein C8R46DRAFT_1031025 [Mycena filopes]
MSSPALTVNNTPCGGAGNVHNGCQHILIYSNPSHFVCFQCEKLTVADLSDLERKSVEAYKSCSMCGLTDNEENGLKDPGREAARIMCPEKSQKMFGTNPQPLVERTNCVGANRGASWTIIYTVRTDNKIDNQFGRQTYPAESDKPYLDNFRISPEATTLSVKNLYMHYLSRSDRQLALRKDNTKTNKGLPKGTYMDMEIIVDKISYLKHVASIMSPIDTDKEEESQSKRKRRISQGSDNTVKRSKTSQVGVILSSSFAPGVTFNVAAPKDSIKFVAVTCTIDSNTGAVSMDKSHTVQTGKIEL